MLGSTSAEPTADRPDDTPTGKKSWRWCVIRAVQGGRLDDAASGSVFQDRARRGTRNGVSSVVPSSVTVWARRREILAVLDPSASTCAHLDFAVALTIARDGKVLPAGSDGFKALPETRRSLRNSSSVGHAWWMSVRPSYRMRRALTPTFIDARPLPRVSRGRPSTRSVPGHAAL